MYNKSSKPQVEYSLTKLTGGLFYYLQSKKIEDIRVTDICKKANITRRTYYRNVDDKIDLVHYGIDRLVNELLENTDFSSSDGRSMYQKFFSFWELHKDFLNQLERNHLFDLFLQDFSEICCTSMRYPLQDKAIGICANKDMLRKYSNAFVIGGLGQMLKAWVLDGFSPSAEEIAETISFLLPVAM